jgi:hypothetical protein
MVRPALTCPHCGKEVRKATGTSITLREFCKQVGLEVPEDERFDDALLRPKWFAATPRNPYWIITTAGNKRCRIGPNGEVDRLHQRMWQPAPAQHIPHVVARLIEVLEFNKNRRVE